jgi:aspartate aminotransferase
MTGWRIGFVFGPKELIKKVTMLQGQSTSGAAIMCQWAAVAALENHERIISEIKKEMQKRRDVFVNTFNGLFKDKIKTPAASLYSFIPVSYFNSDKKSVDFSKEILEKLNIAIVPGESFGEDEYVRFSFGISEDDIKDGLLILRNYVLPS